MNKFIALAFLMMAFSLNAFADQPMSLIKTLCIPEPGTEYFSVNVESFAEMDWYLSYGAKGAPKERADRAKGLEKYGLIVPDKFSYACNLSKHKYTISGYLPPGGNGQCGGDPRIVLSLQQDNTVILDTVFFTPSCFSSIFKDPKPYIKSIIIDTDAGGGYQKLLIQFSDGITEHGFSLRNQKTPITQKDLDCLVEQKFLDPKSRKSAYDNCIKRAASN